MSRGQKVLLIIVGVFLASIFAVVTFFVVWNIGRTSLPTSTNPTATPFPTLTPAAQAAREIVVKIEIDGKEVTVSGEGESAKIEVSEGGKPVATSAKTPTPAVKKTPTPVSIPTSTPAAVSTPSPVPVPPPTPTTMPTATPTPFPTLVPAVNIIELVRVGDVIAEAVLSAGNLQVRMRNLRLASPVLVDEVEAEIQDGFRQNRKERDVTLAPSQAFVLLERSINQEVTVKVELGVDNVLRVDTRRIGPLSGGTVAPTPTSALGLQITTGIRVEVLADNTGQRIPGARVKLAPVSTPSAGTVVYTSADGRVVSDLPAGNWTVSVSATGFAEKILPSVTVVAGQISTIRARLQPQ